MRALSLKGRAMMLLARREHSRQELRAKLLPMALAEERERSPSAVADDAPASARPAGAVPAGALPAGRSPGAAAAPAAAERVDALLDWLETRGYLNDQRFAEARAHTRAARCGNLRIRSELARHGVQLDSVAERKLRDSELERARAAWQRKFGQVGATPAERARQMRFLAARGFSSDVIRQVTRGAPEDD